MHPHSILYHLYKAVDEFPFEEEMYLSDHPPMDQAVKEALSTAWRIDLLLEKLLLKKIVISIIGSLKESKVDYTLLLYLQLPKSLRGKSELISSLETICSNEDFKWIYFYQSVWEYSHFYSFVWEYFENEGVRPITPDKFITANRKEEILKEYERVKKSWGKHSPLFLQMYDTKDGKFINHVYFICRTVQDGILRLLDILKAGEFVLNGRVYTACGAFEHVIGPSTLTCQLYDCEVMSSAFTEPMEEVKEMVRGFPKFLANVLIQEDLISIETFVTFSVKDRTRQIGDGKVKISFHFTPFICAPKSVHSKVMKVCLKDYKGEIDEAAACIKSTGMMPGGLLPKPFRTLDYQAVNNGITTAFSRKTRADIFPRHVYTEELCGGCFAGREECAIDPQDLHGDNLTDKERLMLIFRQLYTAPKREMICYTEDTVKTLLEETDKVFFKNFNFLNFVCSHWDSNPYTPEELSLSFDNDESVTNQ